MPRVWMYRSNTERVWWVENNNLIQWSSSILNSSSKTPMGKGDYWSLLLYKWREKRLFFCLLHLLQQNWVYFSDAWTTHWLILRGFRDSKTLAAGLLPPSNQMSSWLSYPGMRYMRVLPTHFTLFKLLFRIFIFQKHSKPCSQIKLAFKNSRCSLLR